MVFSCFLKHGVRAESGTSHANSGAPTPFGPLRLLENEQIKDPQVYQQFFAKLSKSVFLLANDRKED